MRVFMALAGLLIATGAQAQTSWTKTTVGPYTNYTGQVDGQPFNLTESQVGPVRNLTGRIGGQQIYCSSYSIGPYANTSCH